MVTILSKDSWVNTSQHENQAAIYYAGYLIVHYCASKPPGSYTENIGLFNKNLVLWIMNFLTDTQWYVARLLMITVNLQLWARLKPNVEKAQSPANEIDENSGIIRSLIWSYAVTVIYKEIKSGGCLDHYRLFIKGPSGKFRKNTKTLVKK